MVLKVRMNDGMTEKYRGEVTMTVGSKKTIGEILSDVSTATGIKENLLVCTFAGRKLALAQDVSSVGISDEGTLLVYRRSVDDSPLHKQTVSPSRIEAVVTSFSSAMRDGNQKSLLYRIMTGSTILPSLLNRVPGLKTDSMAQGVLSDMFLLVHWLSPKNIQKTADLHPCIIEGAQQIITMVHEEVLKQRKKAPGYMPVEHLSGMMDHYDDEDTEDEDGDQRGGGGLAQQFTVDNLAQAIAAATGGVVPSSSGGSAGVGRGRARPPLGSFGGQSTSTGRGSEQPLITQSLFQEAMSQALGTMGGTGGATGTTATAANPENMAQLKDMGFFDDNENRTALNATGGDVEAALEWIITRREQSSG